jgi:hypothetical protein
MRDTVNLCRNTVRKANGAKYSYWVLRWRDASGKHHGKTIGRVGEMSKRQAEKLRQQKALELAGRPGRRSVSRAPVLGDFLEAYYAAREAELAPGTMELHRQTGRYLAGFFGSGTSLDNIQRVTPGASRLRWPAGS